MNGVGTRSIKEAKEARCFQVSRRTRHLPWECGPPPAGGNLVLRELLQAGFTSEYKARAQVHFAKGNLK